MLLLTAFVSLKSLSLADHVTEACRVGEISGKKCLRQEKNPQPSVWRVHFASLRKEYLLGKLDMTVVWLFNYLYGKENAFPCLQKE